MTSVGKVAKHVQKLISSFAKNSSSVCFFNLNASLKIEISGMNTYMVSKNVVSISSSLY